METRKIIRRVVKLAFLNTIAIKRWKQSLYALSTFIFGSGILWVVRQKEISPDKWELVGGISAATILFFIADFSWRLFPITYQIGQESILETAKDLEHLKQLHSEGVILLKTLGMHKHVLDGIPEIAKYLDWQTAVYAELKTRLPHELFAFKTLTAISSSTAIGGDTNAIKLEKQLKKLRFIIMRAEKSATEQD